MVEGWGFTSLDPPLPRDAVGHDPRATSGLAEPRVTAGAGHAREGVARADGRIGRNPNRDRMAPIARFQYDRLGYTLNFDDRHRGGDSPEADPCSGLALSKTRFAATPPAATRPAADVGGRDSPSSRSAAGN